MANRIIEVRVDNKIASVISDPLYVCGNSDYVVKFAFDDEWADHTMKTARFIKSNSEYFDVVFNGIECPMPIIDNTSYVKIGVYAGNLCTTTAAIVNAQRSILCGSGVPAEPDPDVYSQIMERIDNLNIPDQAEYSKMITDQIDTLNIPDLTKRVDALQSNAVIAQHVHGDMLHIEDAAAWQAEKVVTHIEPMQAGSGDPSPYNERPSSGWDSINAWASGANMYNPETVTKGYAISTNGGTYVSRTSLTTDYIPVKGGQKIVIGWSEARWGGFYTDAKPESFIETFGSGGVAPIDAKYMRITAPIGDEKTLYVSYANTKSPNVAHQGMQHLTAKFRTGKNLFDQSAHLTNNVTLNSWYYTTLKMQPNTIYTMSCDIPEAGKDYVAVFAFNSGASADGAKNQVYKNRPVQITTLDDGIIKIQYRKTSADYDMLWYKYQLEPGSIATAYEPYTGNQFGQTIYGGDFTWKTGKLISGYHKIIFDGVTVGRKVDNTDPGVTTYAYILQPNLPKPLKNNGRAYANKLKSVGTSTVISFGLPDELTGVTRTDDTATVAAKYNAVLQQWYAAGTPLEIVYELATPEEIQLAPQQMPEMLKGVNNVWCDAGETEMVYIADNQLYIDQKIGESTAALNAIMEGINNA